MAIHPPSSDADEARVSWVRLQSLSDERLIEELLAGNTDAFAVVFQRFHRLVHVTALRILRDAGEAEDITQAIFLEVFRKAEQFDPAKGTLKVWLLQYTYCRCRSRRNYLLVRQFYSQSTLEGCEGEDGETLWSANRLPFQETLCLTKEALAVLPDSQRVTIEMFFFDGLTLKEIAERRNENFSNVRHHYYRGLERLRLHLGLENA